MSNPALNQSHRLKTLSAPRKISNVPSQAYVMSLTELPICYAASTSSPSNVIPLYDKYTLQCLQTLHGHEIATTSLKTVDRLAEFTRPTLVSSGKDGAVKFWDERTNAAALTASAPGRPLLSCDVSADGLTIAAGTDLQGDDALILYWDPRNPATPLRTHSSTHSDDITAVHFKPTEPHHILLSASSDGLISISNADESDEEESVLNVGNWGCSISQAGWIHGKTGPSIWAASDMETFSTWSSELDIALDMDIRGPSVHNQQTTWVTDYVIAGHSTKQSNGLSLFVGSNEGDVALISSSNISNPTAPWFLHNLWTTSHVGVVRSVLWDEHNNVLVTGGEDSRINLWTGPDSSVLIDDPGDLMDVDERL